MPTCLAASRIIVPSGTSATIPLMVNVGMGPLESPPERAGLLRDVAVEFLAEFPDERLGRHHRGIRQCADRPPHHVVADVEDQLDVAGLALPLLDAAHDLREPAGPLPARSALA